MPRGVDHQLAAIGRATRRRADYLRAIAQADQSELLTRLGTTPAGLAPQVAEELLAVHGHNVIRGERRPHWVFQFLSAFGNPFTLTLLGLAGVLAWIGDLSAVAILTTMVLLSTSITFWQEYRSNRAADRLRAMISTTVRVRRGIGTETDLGARVPVEEIVPGDIVELTAGDLVPADCLILRASGVTLTQATLTGEALPVEKTAVWDTPDDTIDPPDIPNVCLLGTSLITGSATGLVVTTGDTTYLGSMADALTQHEPATAFDHGMKGVTWTLLRFMAAMVPVVFVLNGITTGNWGDAFQFAIAVAVGLTPEMLPVVVTANLVRGGLDLSRRDVIVKELAAIQNFGGMSVLCTDKTGTLTEDRITLRHHIDSEGNSDGEVLDYAWLNSSLQSGIRNPLDLAVVEAVGPARSTALREKYSLDAEIPFDFERRRLTVLVSDGTGAHLVVTKGAVEEVLECAAKVRVAMADRETWRVAPLDETRRLEVTRLVRQMRSSGMRVLAVAVRRLDTSDGVSLDQVEDELTLIGFLAFDDPPKASAAPAVESLRRDGVDIKVVTGDSPEITVQVCKEVGIEVEGVVEGSELDALSDADLVEVTRANTVFAKVDPLEKARIVRALQADGETVGFLGDGINDAAALREADVGISVDSAVDIAQEAADIILLRKDLVILERGVRVGRRTFGNIMKYLKLTLSSNLGNVVSVLVASAFLPFLPMLPLQLLFQNLLYDVSQLTIPLDTVDPEYLRRPQPWTGRGLGRFMLIVGPVSSIFDLTMFAVLWYVFGANSIHDQSLFQAGWFVLGLVSQVMVVHLIRTEKIPFFQSRASWPLIVSSGIIIALALWVPFTPVGAALRFAELPPAFFPWLVATLLAYAVVLEVVKRWYIRRFGSWL